MMSFEEQVNMWFEDGLQIVDEDGIIGYWFRTLGKLHPTVSYHEISKFLDPFSKHDEWINAEWKHDVKKKLLSLEYHLG